MKSPGLTPDLPLNPVVRDMPEATSILINQMVYDCRRAGVDVITLSLGEAYFDLPMMDFSRLDLEKSYHYSESRGLLELRQRLAAYYGRQFQAPVDPLSEIVISAGSKPLIFMAILAAVATGDEVLIQEPAWLSYPHHVRLAGGVPKFIPFDCAVDNFARFFTARTRMLVICNPNNPAGRIYTRDELSRLYEMCRRRGVYLLVDEAYGDFVVGEDFTSIVNVVPSKDGIIATNSLSKSMGISGWRIGYAISDAKFVFQLLKLNQHIVTCAPTILLMYCDRYFDELLSVSLPQVREVVAKRQRVRAMLDEFGLGAMSGGSTFYFFISIANYPGNSTEFALNLLSKRRVAVVPGSAYGTSTDRFVRISIGTESEERIRQALSELRHEIDVNAPSAERLDRHGSVRHASGERLG
jgi:aspartate/methionine/tyrosine aminotransferase